MEFHRYIRQARVHLWVHDAGEFKESEHPREKSSGKFTKGGGGGGGGKAVPAPPQVKSQHAANVGKQKHLNALHALAEAGSWEQIAAYPTPGTNTYAKMVQKYKADLLEHAPEGTEKPAEPKPPEPKAELSSKLYAPLKNAIKAKGFALEGSAGAGSELYKHPETGFSLIVDPPANSANPMGSSSWTLYSPNGQSIGSDFGWVSRSNAISKANQARAVAPEPTLTAEPKPQLGFSGVYEKTLTSIGFTNVGTSNITGNTLFQEYSTGNTVLVTGPTASSKGNAVWELITGKGLTQQKVSGEGLGALEKALLASKAQPAAPEPTPAPAAPKHNIAAPVELAGMEQIGPKKGSNPGGTFKDNDGKEYYVKFQKSEDHAKNELLAASLFAAAGGNTLVYHPVSDPEGKPATATELEKLSKDNVSQLSPEQRKLAQRDFALHVWLANWDAAGLTGDNVGTVGNTVLPLDFGGSLLYRAQGAPKGAAFGNQADEWTSLRSSSKNPSAAKLYGSMTKEQLLESAQRLGSIRNDDIISLVDQYGPGDTMAKAALAEKLAKRRNSVMQQAVAEANKPAPPPPEPPNTPKPLSSAAAIPPQAPAEIKELIDSKQYGGAYHALESHAPKITDTQETALLNYKGASYVTMNECMRSQDNCNDVRVKELQGWLAQAKTPMPMTVWRRLKGSFADALYSVGTVGMRFQERGFMSTSLDPGPMASWGKLTMEIQAPEGMPGTTVNNQGESEVLFNRGIHLTIKSFDRNKKHMVVTMDAGKPGEELA
jgi:hypothetical protein